MSTISRMSVLPVQIKDIPPKVTEKLISFIPEDGTKHDKKQILQRAITTINRVIPLLNNPDIPEELKQQKTIEHNVQEPIYTESGELLRYIHTTGKTDIEHFSAVLEHLYNLVIRFKNAAHINANYMKWRTLMDYIDKINPIVDYESINILTTELENSQLLQKIAQIVKGPPVTFALKKSPLLQMPSFPTRRPGNFDNTGQAAGRRRRRRVTRKTKGTVRVRRNSYN